MYTRDDAGEVSITVLTVIEEVGHNLGQHLMVVEDEVVLGVTDTFVGEQVAGREVKEMSRRRSSVRLATAFLWLGAASISKSLRQRSIPY